MGKWFLKWKTFLRRWNWEEKSSTIYHCTVFGWVIKSVLPFVLLRVWFKYSRWQKKLFNTDFWFLNPVKMFWSSQKCWGWPKIVLDSVQRGKKGSRPFTFLKNPWTRTKIIWSGSNILDRTNKQVFITYFWFLNQIQNVFGLGPNFFGLVQSIIQRNKNTFYDRNLPCQ